MAKKKPSAARQAGETARPFHFAPESGEPHHEPVASAPADEAPKATASGANPHPHHGMSAEALRTIYETGVVHGPVPPRDPGAGPATPTEVK